MVLYKNKTIPLKCLSCSACSSMLECKLSKLPGIQEANVNLMTEKHILNMIQRKQVLLTADFEKTIEKLGYADSRI